MKRLVRLATAAAPPASARSDAHNQAVSTTGPREVILMNNNKAICGARGSGEEKSTLKCLKAKRLRVTVRFL